MSQRGLPVSAASLGRATGAHPILDGRIALWRQVFLATARRRGDYRNVLEFRHWLRLARLGLRIVQHRQALHRTHVGPVPIIPLAGESAAPRSRSRSTGNSGKRPAGAVRKQLAGDRRQCRSRSARAPAPSDTSPPCKHKVAARMVLGIGHQHQMGERARARLQAAQNPRSV